MIPVMGDILAARQRLRGRVGVTPFRRSDWMSAAAGIPVALKLECVQRTGSFKIRGACNALLRFRADAAASPGRPRIVTASAGNHGRALAFAAEALGFDATVFAPRLAPRAKLDAIARHGADLRLVDSYDDAERAARAVAGENGVPFISPYNHPDVIAGAGTIALELFEAEPAIDAIVVPVGGGGLISGIAIAAKSIAPGVKVVGVEAAASTAVQAGLRAGRVVEIHPGPTLADGLAGNLEPGTITLDIVRRCVDEMVTVSEDEICHGMRGLLLEEHVVAEGAGAAAVAALLAGKVRAAGVVAALVTGANVDADRLAAALRPQPD